MILHFVRNGRDAHLLQVLSIRESLSSQDEHLDDEGVCNTLCIGLISHPDTQDDSLKRLSPRDGGT